MHVSQPQVPAPAPAPGPFAALRLTALLLIPTLLGAACRQDPPPPHALRISVDRAGPVRLTAADLRRAGLDPADPRAGDLRLLEAGQPVPFQLRPGSLLTPPRIDFVAADPEAHYDGRRHYLLLPPNDPPPGPPPPQDPAASLDQTPPTSRAPDLPPALDSGASFTTLTLEPRESYQPIRAHDPWLGPLVAAPSQSAELSFDLPPGIPGPARLRLRYWSPTEAPADPDHHLRLLFNDQLVAESRWDGAGDHHITATLTPDLLRAGPNHLSLEAPGLPDVRAETGYPDRLAIDHAPPPRPPDDRLLLTLGDPPLRLTGSTLLHSQGRSRFRSPPEIHPLDPTGRPQSRAPESAPSWPSRPGQQLWAVGRRGWQSPESIQAATLTPDLRTLPGADWLAIAPTALSSPLAPLLQRHTDQGLTSLHIPYEAIRDQFGHGAPTPESIRAFLLHATTHWPTPPRYILLVGDMSEDPHDLTPDAPFLPTAFIDTTFGGRTASDPLLADLDADGLPDLPIGRVPARTPAQVETFVTKTLAHSTSTHPSSILAVADPSQAPFRTDAQAFLDHFPPESSPRLHNPSDPASPSASLSEALTSPPSLLAYFGHGSTDRWGRDALLQSGDLPTAPASGPIPLTLQFTCLTGLFTSRQTESLAEALLFHPTGGSIATLAPTSLTLAFDQSFLADSLATTLSRSRPPSAPPLRLGDAILTAWQSAPPDSPQALEVTQTFHVLGDPALVVGPSP